MSPCNKGRCMQEQCMRVKAIRIKKARLPREKKTKLITHADLPVRSRMDRKEA